MIGQTVSHYRIVRKLGGGGMGVVYEAADLSLKRRVALKFLSDELAGNPDALQRLEREAQAASALNHPYICTIHEIGEHEGQRFLVMELLNGTSLAERLARGPMTSDEVVRVGTQLADALDTAHRAGIVHRDLKPANLFLTERGDLKVLDFGLAKLGPDPGDSASELPTERADEPLTSPGTTLGTVAYMSPEQVRGEDLDARTDLYSAGVVLYELLTGKKPFRGETPGMVYTAIMTKEPTPPSEIDPGVPPNLERTILRLLEKDKQNRYRTADSLLGDLREPSGSAPAASLAASPPAEGTAGKRRPAWIWVAGLATVVAIAWYWSSRAERSGDEPGIDATVPAAAVPGPAARTIIVLPFHNLGAAEDEYFALGVSDEISAKLGTISGLAVISRNTAQRYAGTDKTIRQIGEELGVSHVLEGRVQWARDGDGASRVRIIPELIRVADDTQLWSATFDREIDDIFAVQGEIAEQVAQGLGIELAETEAAALEERLTTSNIAYQAYLRGQDIVRQRGVGDPAGRAEAVRVYELAVDEDPSFAHAWGRLTRALGVAIINGDYSGDADTLERAMKRIEYASSRAMEIDSDSPYSLMARAYYLYYGLQDFERASELFVRVAEALPNDAEAFNGLGAIQRRLGRWQKSIEAYEAALRLDPGDVNLLISAGQTYHSVRDHDRAAERYDRALVLAPDIPIQWEERAWVELDGRGSIAGSRAVLDRSLEDDPGRYIDALKSERDWSGLLEAIEAEVAPNNRLRYRSTGIEAVDADTARAARLLDAALAHRELGRPDEAAATFEEAGDLVREAVEGGTRTYAAFVYAYSQLALGELQDALRLAEELTSTNADDLFIGPCYKEWRALILAHAGDQDRAIDLVEELLETDYWMPLTVHRLRLSPWWDPLRGNARFESLIKSSTA